MNVKKRSFLNFPMGKYKLILGLIMLSIFSSFVFASNAPPPIPTEYWGRLMIDGSPAPDGTEVKYFDGTDWIITTTVDGWYTIIMTGGDSDLTFNDDHDCTAHWNAGEACIPCTQNVDCIEGPQTGNAVTIYLGNTPASVTWGDDTSSDESIMATLHFTPGWNLFSFPALPNNPSLSFVLLPIDGKYSSVWTKLGGVWKSSTQPFAPLTSFDLDKSYYIYINSSGLVDLGIQGVPQPQTTINLISGWNLVGYPKYTSSLITDILSGVTYDIGWTKVNGIWKSSTQPFSPITQFEPGRGYFIYTDTSGSYDVTN